MSFARILVLAFVFICCLAPTIALRCYNCMSSRDGNCDDTAEMEYKDCDTSVEASNSLHAQPVCLKVVKDIRGVDHITRSCTFSGSLFNPCNQHLSAEHCSVCDSNLCNTSTRISINPSVIIAGFIFKVLHAVF